MSEPDWRASLVSPRDSISRVIENLDGSALQIALVVASDEKLLGTVTDGDVRRALLKGLSLDSPVSDIMNRDPVTCSPNDPDSKFHRLMTSRKLYQFPLVDEGGVLRGLRTRRDLFAEQTHENPVFIMAGGFGRRLGHLTDHKPKPMLSVAFQFLKGSSLV